MKEGNWKQKMTLSTSEIFQKVLDLRWKQESFLHMSHVDNWLYLNYDRMGHGNYRAELDLIKMNYAGRS
jgi:hypothetical protein